MEELIWKMLKFGLVGFSGLLIDFGITYLFKEKLHTHKYLANALGFAVAVTSNYLLNRIWTFESQSSALGREYGLFLLFCTLGLGINTLILFIGHHRFRLQFYKAKLVAIVLTTGWNFVTNYLFTFPSA